MHADALHHAHRPARRHLRAIDGRGGQRFVIRLKSADAVLVDEVFDVAEDVEKSGDGRAGIAGEEVNAAFDFEAAFHQQFIAGKNLGAGFGQKTGVSCHVYSRSLCAA